MRYSFGKTVAGSQSTGQIQATGVITTGSAGTVGPRITSFTNSGLITVTSGQTISGLWITRTSGTGPCITIANGATNVIIEDCKIGPNSDAADTGTGISVTNGGVITINNCSFDAIATSFYAVTSTGPIKFHHNYNTRIRGPNFATGGSRGQMVQFNACTAPGSKIMYNVSDLTNPGYLDGPEDHVNMYASHGTAGNPIIIKYNKCRGGGPSNSGGGILAGDNGGSHIHIISNNVVNCGQYGVGIPGGDNNKLINKKVYGQQFAWSNVGIMHWKWNLAEPACFGHTVTGNRVWWINSNGSQNHFWEPESTSPNYCTGATFSGNVFGDATINASIWDEVFPEEAV